MRIDHGEVERFMNLDSLSTDRRAPQSFDGLTGNIHIAGSHDFLIEHLIKYVTKQADFLSLQPTYIGSLEGLMMLYRGNCDAAAIHLLDPSTGEYNLPFIKMFFIHDPLTVIRLASREQGLLVAKGNPKKITEINDLARKDVNIINRQKGAGTRFLLDSLLAKNNLHPSDINGYENEEWTHLSTASYISRGVADCALGIQAAASQLNLDFIPIATEQFDLVFRWTDKNQAALQHLLDLIQLTDFKESVTKLEGYNTTEFGKILLSNRQED